MWRFESPDADWEVSRLSLSRRSLEKTSGAEIFIHEKTDENHLRRIDSLDADGGSSRASLSRRSLEKPLRDRLGGPAPHTPRWKGSGSSLRRGSLARSSGPTTTTVQARRLRGWLTPLRRWAPTWRDRSGTRIPLEGRPRCGSQAGLLGVDQLKMGTDLEMMLRRADPACRSPNVLGSGWGTRCRPETTSAGGPIPTRKGGVRAKGQRERCYVDCLSPCAVGQARD